ncbi:Transcriptional adapter 1-like protein [Camponotus floridanus]|uniref:Transcriptional adapter 1-like protein n=1 Tax=Camponotus floridanus TaxID=104421 RepID=E2A3P4_CAMFO|nr:transcriptional adapter 1 [Camponotus floridanus]EFN71936.1 Transcriptional adapter 1-like protein [Camponotus floridanus]
MTTSKELNLARKSLVASLGENAKAYFEKMKLWFQMKTTKEEFDCEARNLMTEDQVRLHNEFLLCLFNKVRGLATITPTYKIDRDKTSKERRLRLKRKYKTDKSNFEPADMYVEVLGQASSPVGDEPIGANRSSAQELVLPDRTFVLARLMLAAWENNMDGAEENTAHIIIAATQIFLKNILTAVFTRRKGYAVYDGAFIYNIGEPVPSSWKRNSMYINPFRSEPTEVLEPYGQIPASKPNFEEAEQATAFSYACSSQSTRPPLKPVSTADLQYALKIYKNLVSNHTIYATNMERLYTYATHPTWEDLEAKKLLCQSLT